MSNEHTHCPRGCEHPQPFHAADRLNLLALAMGMRPGVLYCGQCWFQRMRVVRMYVCNCPNPHVDIT